MDGNKDAREIQHGGKNGLQHDLAIGQIHIVRHQEGRGAHDGRHDLAAGGRGCLCGSGKLRLIAGFLHQGDGDRTGTDGVRHRRTGNHTLHGADHNGNLCRAAGKSAHGCVGNIDEEIRNSRPLQKCAEDNEHHNKLGADIDGCGQDAFLAVEQVADRIVQLTPQGGVGQTPNQRVGNEAPGHDQNGQTHTAAADLCQRQNAHNADDDLIPRKLASLLDDIHGVEGEIQKRAAAGDHHDQIIPGNVIDLMMLLVGRKHQKTQKYDPCHERGQPQLLQPAGEQGHIDAEERKEHRQTVDDDLGNALPHARVRLAVELAHNLIKVWACLPKCGRWTPDRIFSSRIPDPCVRPV